ncbi:MAG TPA: hypothetical protein VN213_12030, partial [Solirubrobacteraceae bacterium]|nr:hypothetical protein [Solirubrobacteraceae bacterium]
MAHEPARVDAEYRALLGRTAQEALAEARARLPADVAASVVVREARSAPGCSRWPRSATPR